MMKYPKDYLDEIKLRVKVSQIVGKVVQLKKRGKEFIGLSPFKNEKTPSFTVSDEKGFYHCFSSGEHGNIFDFLMKTKSIGFGEAVKVLASEAGMQPYKFSNFDEKKNKRFETYKNIYKEFLEYFQKELLNSENSEALNYLKKRKIEINLIKDFGLGYVPWKDNFYDNLLKKYNEEEINLTGLFYKNEKSGKFINRFNSRIIFPIKNISGDCIAFGGRIFQEKKLAKYINSPETEFYKKGKTLFNLDKARACRSETNQVIIVEGYMDVISLNSFGIKNVISNQGIAITQSQIELVWRFFSDPIICLDGDESGQTAALRIAENLISLVNENNKIFFLILSKGEDPDDFIKKNGKEKFNELIKSKQVIQSYIWNMYLKNIKKNNPYEVSKFEKKIKNICFSIKDEILRKHILEDFLEKIRSLTPIQNSKKVFRDFIKKDNKILNETKVLHKQKNSFTKEQIKEYSILYVMLNYPDTVKSKIEELTQVKFSFEENNNLKDEIIKSNLNDGNLEKNKIKIREEFKNLVDEIEKNSSIKNIMSNKNPQEKEEIIDELLEDLKEMNQIKKIQFLESKIAKNLDENSYSELIKLKNQLNRE
tara:strand:- start:1491 stop:3272 length:1782 start_codon:yes stop_codon:yes gene_type:complete